MSDSHIIFGDTTIGEWIDRYEQSHKHPVNNVFHTLGIPMIAISLPLFLIALLFRDFWKIPLSLFTLGWIFQFAGHTLEGKPPEFFKDWRFLLVGLRWWWKKMKGRPFAAAPIPEIRSDGQWAKEPNTAPSGRKIWTDRPHRLAPLKGSRV